MDDKGLREKAEKRVEEKKGFYWDLGAYVVVNAGLFLIWLFTGAGYPWFVWPLLGWGIGVVFHKEIRWIPLSLLRGGKRFAVRRIGNPCLGAMRGDINAAWLYDVLSMQSTT